VIEGAIPRAFVVTRLAFGPQFAFVKIVAVASCTRRRDSRQLPVDMTAIAAYIHMGSTQGETCLGMIDRCVPPISRVVARFTCGAQAALMHVVCLMAGDTCT
jgi:hypothetical protein